MNPRATEDTGTACHGIDDITLLDALIDGVNVMKHFSRIIHSVSILLIMAITVCVLYHTDKLLRPKDMHGMMQAGALYYQPKNTIDVAFMGSSHIYYNVNTALLWEKYGMAAYDYGAAEQPLSITYHYLIELCKYQNPKLIVLDLFGPAEFKEDYQYTFLRDNLYGMRFSINKLQMLYASCEPSQYFEYFPGWLDYHDRYRSLNKADWNYMTSSSKEKASFKGYTPYTNNVALEEPELTQDLSGDITVKSEIYLQRIIDYTAEHDIDLFLIVAPYPTNDSHELVYNRVHEIADRAGIRFNSTNYFYDHMDLNFETDFNDLSHLNYAGSCKFTDYLAGEIVRQFDIPDRRGCDGYESWDQHVTDVQEMVQKE